MISNRPMIPMLTHVDNLGDLNIDMTPQEQEQEQEQDQDSAHLKGSLTTQLQLTAALKLLGFKSTELKLMYIILNKKLLMLSIQTSLKSRQP